MTMRIYRAFCFVFAACALLYAAMPVCAADTVKVSDINIRVHCPAEKQAFWHAFAASVIPVTVGDAYTIQTMDRAIKALTQAALFEFIHVPDPEQSDRGMVLFFELTPFCRIQDIHIQNAFPIFEQEVLNAMTVKVGGVYQKKKMADQARRVEALFKRRGFYAPKVTVSALKSGNDYVIGLDIDKGPFHNIRKVAFRGNDHISKARLKFVTRTFRTSLLPFHGNRFTEKKMKADTRTITEIYRKKGYADVQVTAETIPVNGSDAVDVIFTIDEGPLYKIDFQGNEALYSWSLKKNLLLEKDGNKNNVALKKSMRNIRKRYAAKGFADAAVKAQTTDSQHPFVRQVNIRIEEGIRYVVSELDIRGAQTLPVKEIKKHILTREKRVFTKTILDDDLKAIQALYLTNGFTETKVSKKIKPHDVPEKNEKQVAVEIIIKEGPRTMVEQVDIQGLSAISLDEAVGKMTMKAGLWYDNALLEDDLSALRQAISEKGFPHVQVTADVRFSKDRTRGWITCHVDQGPRVVVGRIFYTGNLRLKQETLENEMEIVPGDPFSMFKIVASRRNIQNLNAVDTVRIRHVGLKHLEPEVDLIVEISEKKPYYVELSGGYDTARHLYMETGIGDKNFMGRNLDVQARFGLSQVGYDMAVSLTEPRFLSGRFISTSKVYSEKTEAFNKDYGITTYGLSQTFLRKFDTTGIRLSLGMGYEYRNQYLRVDPRLDDETHDYGVRHMGQINTGLTFRTTDSLVHPRSGVFASTTFDLFKGIDSDLDDVYKYGLSLRYYLPVTDDLVIAMRGRCGYMNTYGGNTYIADDQRYFLGGGSTVRGFAENMLRSDDNGNALGGRSMVLGSAEARYDLGSGYEIALFFDTGALSRTRKPGVPESFRSSAGIGLRRQTPVGPISFLYGWKLSPHPGESRGCFHFSLGYTF